MLPALMQNRPLLVSSLIEHASACHGDAEIVSGTLPHDVHRCTYRDLHRRACQLANALTAIGVKHGDRVATLARNGYRQMELHYAVSGMGAVLHTIDPRLPPGQIEYIVNHAQDRLLCFDGTFAPLIESLLPRFHSLKDLVILADRNHVPQAHIPDLLHYEELLAEYHDDFAWPALDETAAASLCHASGITGQPRGVLLSHRATVLHAFAACAADGLALSAMDSALVVTPMSHLDACGLSHAGAMCGAKLLLPGQALDGKRLFEMLRDERVTVALGAPAAWPALLQYVAANAIDARRELQLRRVVMGGWAVPHSLCKRFATVFGAVVVQASHHAQNDW